jgi:hypothetical protein
MSRAKFIILVFCVGSSSNDHKTHSIWSYSIPKELYAFLSERSSVPGRPPCVYIFLNLRQCRAVGMGKNCEVELLDCNVEIQTILPSKVN